MICKLCGREEKKTGFFQVRFSTPDICDNCETEKGLLKLAERNAKK